MLEPSAPQVANVLNGLKQISFENSYQCKEFRYGKEALDRARSRIW